MVSILPLYPTGKVQVTPEGVVYDLVVVILGSALIDWARTVTCTARISFGFAGVKVFVLSAMV